MFEVDELLSHHGVKGMKWGVRNEKKTSSSPLQRLKEHNIRVNKERKANLTARAAKTNVLIKEIDQQLQSKSLSRSYRGALSIERMDLQALRSSDLRKAERTSDSAGLTSGQKKALIGAGVVAGGLAAYGVYRLVGTDEGKAFVRSIGSKIHYGEAFKTNASFKNADSVDDIMNGVIQGINPNYSTNGGKMNCRRCTFAYELRRRGYDVQATTTAFGKGQNETGLINALIKGDKNIRGATSLSSNASDWDKVLGLRTRNVGDTRIDKAIRDTVKDFSNSEPLRRALSKHPVGSRGEIVFDQGPFAHSLQWEVFKDGIHMFDSQKGQHFPVTDEGLSKFFFKWGNSKGAEITRLDNIDLDLPFLGQWVKNS